MKVILRFFSAIWTGINVFRRIVLNLLFLVLFFAVIAAISNQPSRPAVIPDGAALVLSIRGQLVEVATPPTLNASLSGGPEAQTELRPLINTIHDAAEDEYIRAIMLDLSQFTGGGFTKLRDLGEALDYFKAQDKPVYAYGDNFSQGQYYLAAHATELMLNPMGSVELMGFSTWQPFYADALEKLSVDVNIFRVGEFKAAVEPYMLNGMSEEAKENIGGVLGDAWNIYMEDLYRIRPLDQQVMQTYLNTPNVLLAEYSGDTAAMALDTGLVDMVTDRQGASDRLKEALGIDDDTESWPRISLADYRFIRNNPLLNPGEESGNRIGVIMASGEIVDGKGGNGTIGGDSLVELIRSARENDDLKALVLRVDSPGGSAFASELIRSELEHFADTDRPLVVSMGSTAASGGYWISTPAQEIWASPATITGSIGIYGMLPTFDRALERIGVNIDGVGTTANSGGMVVGQPLSPELAETLQLSVSHGYETFLELVSESRDMSRDAVDEVARGQVWSGQRALELGLVDQLGDLDEALASAASLAGLDEWQEQLISPPLSPLQQLLVNLAQNMQDSALVQSLLPDRSNTLMQLVNQAGSPLERLLQRAMYADPSNIFAHCLECDFDLQ